MAALVVGIGLLTGLRELVAIGFLWLTIGTPLWIYDLANGGEFLPFSPFTHIGGMILGLVGMWSLGFPPGSALKGWGALVPVFLLPRWVTPAAANVNLAFSVWPGWEEMFPKYGVYLLAVGALCLAVFATAGLILRKLGFEIDPGRSIAGRADALLPD